MQIQHHNYGRILHLIVLGVVIFVFDFTDRPGSCNCHQVDRRLSAPKPIMAIEHKKVNSNGEKPEGVPAVSVPPATSGAETAKASVPVQTQVPDLLVSFRSCIFFL